MKTGLATEAECRSYPKGPVLEWRNLGSPSPVALPAVDDMPHVVLTSGRAAIFHALESLRLPPATAVLAPTYHCPTMIAPIVMTGLRPRYYPIDAAGLPLLEAVSPDGVGALIVPHYFGVPRSLAAIREWSDRHGVIVIEDCAHTFFGWAGERAVGTWGDLATASVTKFFPVYEAGLLASSRRPVPGLALGKPGVVKELRGLIDVLEFGALHPKAASPGDVLAPLFRLKRWLRGARRRGAAPADAPVALDADSMLRDCRMEAVREAPLGLSRRLIRRLARAPLIAQRRANYQRYAESFSGRAGLRPLFPELPESAVPYVFPLWVDRADRVFAALHARRMPVFRWDRRWPDTPDWPDDVGRLWSHHVIQFLCHQNLDAQDIAEVVAATFDADRSGVIGKQRQPVPQ